MLRKGQKIQSIKAGAFNYLSKPFELDELLMIVQLAIRNVQMEAKIRLQN